MDEASALPVELDETQRQFLRAALLDWGGPAKPTDELAAAMGFGSAETLSREAWEALDNHRGGPCAHDG